MVNTANILKIIWLWIMLIGLLAYSNAPMDHRAGIGGTPPGMSADISKNKSSDSNAGNYLADQGLSAAGPNLYLENPQNRLEYFKEYIALQKAKSLNNPDYDTEAGSFDGHAGSSDGADDDLNNSASDKNNDSKDESVHPLNHIPGDSNNGSVDTKADSVVNPGLPGDNADNSGSPVDPDNYDNQDNPAKQNQSSTSKGTNRGIKRPGEDSSSGGNQALADDASGGIKSDEGSSTGTKGSGEDSAETGGSAAFRSFNQLVLDAIKTYDDGKYPYILNNDYANYNGVSEDIIYKGQVFLKAHPSGNRATHCVGITFEVFFKAMQAWNRQAGLPGDDINGLSFDELYEFMLTWYVANGSKEQSNVAAAVESFGLGKRISSMEDARPGDFMDISRENNTGHTVVFINWIYDNGRIVGLRYWSSQESTGGIAYRTEYFNVKRSDGTKYGNVIKDLVYIARVMP